MNKMDFYQGRNSFYMFFVQSSGKKIKVIKLACMSYFPIKYCLPLNNAQLYTHLWNKIYAWFFSHHIAPIFNWFYKIISIFIDFVYFHSNQSSNNSDRIMHVGEEFKLYEIESRIDNKIIPLPIYHSFCKYRFFLASVVIIVWLL